MSIEVSEKDIEKINRILKRGGATEAIVKVEHGEVVVLQVEKKKI